jgi:hypothetical protein
MRQYSLCLFKQEVKILEEVVSEEFKNFTGMSDTKIEAINQFIIQNELLIKKLEVYILKARSMLGD